MWLIMKIDHSGLSEHVCGPADLKVTSTEVVQFVHGVWYEMRQATIKKCFRKADFMCHDGTVSEETHDLLPEAANLDELWNHVAASRDNAGGALLEEFSNADNAAASCEKSTDEATAEEQLSLQSHIEQLRKQ